MVNSAYTQQLTIKNGLLTNEINAIDIDPYGNVWIATPSGLSKYNGRKITNFTTELIVNIPKWVNGK